MRVATSFILLALGALMLAWECVLVWGRAHGEHWDTISMVMKDAALKSCLLPFGWGLLAGHWWANWDVHDNRAPFTYAWVWITIAGLLLVADVVLFTSQRTAWPLWARVLRYPGLWVVVGTIAGPLSWPQRAVL